MIDEFIDELEQELRAASQRRVRLAAARLPLPPAGAIAILITLAICVIVTIGILQTKTSRPTAAPPPSGSPAGLPASARAIVAEVGALRRSQTSADRVAIRLPPFVTIMPSLTRVATTLADGTKIVLLVGRLHRSGAPPELVRLHPNLFNSALKLGFQELAPSGGAGGGIPQFSASDLRRVQPPGSEDLGRHGATFVGVVPDGVARVRLVFAFRHRHRPLIALLTPTNNIVVFTTTVPWFSGVPTQTTWYGPDGHVIGTCRSAFHC